MGEYYRTNKVYILFNGNLSTEPDEGLSYQEIDRFMESYFAFLNNNMYSENMTTEYIKNQILHFYFVYIHPYFDVNGRTSRTLSMWYLLNKKCYPYIIFNRGITFKGSLYDRCIIDFKKYHDISYFLEFMLQTVKIELEKEYIIDSIEKVNNKKFNALEFQTLLYMLSINGLITVKDFANNYNRFNAKKNTKYIYENMLDPLIQENILKVVRTTNSNMFLDYPNEILEINPNILLYDKNKIKGLVRYK